MGCYDTVVGKCPKCGSPVKIQSKAGRCDLIDYNQDSVPMAIARNIEGDLVCCKTCSTDIEIWISPMIPKNVPVEFRKVEIKATD